MQNLNKSQIPSHRWGVLAAIVILTLASVVWAGETAVDNNFVAYPNNPVLKLGNPGDWDGGTIVLPEALVVNDTYYLFYTGIMTAFSSPSAIGYATSPDGLTWTKHPNNPIFTGDSTGFDAYMVADPQVVYANGTWTLYYAGQPTPPPFPNGLQIGRATASAPAGPWTRDTNPILTLGSSGEWDSGFIEPNTILQTENGFIMYYSGGQNFLSGTGFMIGMATSPDGLNWTKYDDPATLNAPYAESDPILMTGMPGSWDSGMSWEGQVRHTPCGWEMYYSGATNLSESSIGYATSLDGIHWLKDSANPIYEATDDPVTMGTGDVVEVPSVLDVGDERWLYYDYGQGPALPAVGVAMAPLSCHEPAFAISKKGPVTVTSGLPITYTLTITNNTFFTLTNVLISDSLPIGASYVSGGTLVGTVVGWTLPELATMNTLTRQFVVTATTTITNSEYEVTSNEGFTATGQVPVVTVVQPVSIAGLTAVNDSPSLLGQTTTFTATLEAGTDVTYVWDFGDGIMGSEATVAHLYTVTGVYTAVVTATNSLSTMISTTNATVIKSVSYTYLPFVSKS